MCLKHPEQACLIPPLLLTHLLMLMLDYYHDHHHVVCADAHGTPHGTDETPWFSSSFSRRGEDYGTSLRNAQSHPAGREGKGGG